MILEDMSTIQQIQHHVAIYDRLQKQRVRSPDEVMQMVAHANAIIGITPRLPGEADQIRRDMLTSLGVTSIEPNT